MGKNKDESVQNHEAEPKKRKEVCCEKYLKKGKRCKSCPDIDQAVQPE